jgi:hypothetical protein
VPQRAHFVARTGTATISYLDLGCHCYNCLLHQLTRAVFFGGLVQVLTEPLPRSALEGKEPAASQLGYLIHDTSPLRTVLSCVVCFHAAELPCGSSTTFTVALQVTRPLPYPQPTNHLKTRGYRLVGRPANGVGAAREKFRVL